MSEGRLRLARLRERLRDAAVDALYVSAIPNIRYLTGFSGSAGHLLVADAFVALFVDGRYAAQAAEETASVEIVVAETPRKPFEAMTAALGERRIERLGFESRRLTHASWSALAERAGRDRRLTPLEDAVEELRLIKSASEITAIRRAAELNDEVFEVVCKEFQPSWSERRMATEIEYQMALRGASGAAFPSIVASGGHAALPHAQPRDLPLERHTLVVVDHGAILNGYASDMTRMAALGAPSRDAVRLLDAVSEAQAAALDAVQPGIRANDVDKQARETLARLGFGEHFLHSTGHGVGLEIHEAPRLGPGEERVLEIGMVVTIEPGAYVRGRFGARIEDLAAVTAHGCDVLSSSSRELRIL